MIRRAAFASSDGNFIDYHFGLANTFFVYDIGGPSTPPVLTEKRRNFKLHGQGDIVAGMAHHKAELERVAALLSDCDAIFVVRIGASPADFLIERGFRIFQLEGAINEVIAEIVFLNEQEQRGEEGLTI
jgi:hypothetical protein